MFGFEFGQFDALMKLTVVDDDNRLAGSCSRTSLVNDLGAFGLHDDFVVDAELALGHAA